MSVAFWSVKLTNGKAVEVQPPEGYVLNVQQAAYVGEAHTVVKVHTTSVEGDKLESVICTLRNKTADQVSMSLVFGYDVPVAFSAEGKGEVYLSGYYQPGPEEDDENDYDDFDGEDDEEDSEEDSEDEEDDEEEGDEEENIKNAEAAIAKLGASRKNDLVVTGKKAPVAQEDSEDDSEDDEEDSEEDSEDEAVDNAFIAKMIKRNGLAGSAGAPKSSRVQELDAEEEDDSEDEEEDSEDEEEESEEESEEEAPPMKVQKGSAPKGVVTASGHKSAQQAKPVTPSHNNQQQKPKTPQGGNNGNNKTPQGKPNGNNFNKTPNSNNKGGNHNNQNSGFKSGDKRKR